MYADETTLPPLLSTALDDAIDAMTDAGHRVRRPCFSTFSWNLASTDPQKWTVGCLQPWCAQHITVQYAPAQRVRDHTKSWDAEDAVTTVAEQVSITTWPDTIQTCRDTRSQRSSPIVADDTVVGSTLDGYVALLHAQGHQVSARVKGDTALVRCLQDDCQLWVKHTDPLGAESFGGNDDRFPTPHPTNYLDVPCPWPPRSVEALRPFLEATEHRFGDWQPTPEIDGTLYVATCRVCGYAVETRQGDGVRRKAQRSFPSRAWSYQGKDYPRSTLFQPVHECPVLHERAALVAQLAALDARIAAADV